MTLALSTAIAICSVAAAAETPLVVVPDPQAALRPEDAEQSSARHAKVARARDGTVILLHRGAWDYAPENTLSAIRAGFELGASGVELDFRRTKDGVIVLFHDDRLERLLDGVGSVGECYYEEVLLYTYRSLPAPAAQTGNNSGRTRPCTRAADRAFEKWKVTWRRPGDGWLFGVRLRCQETVSTTPAVLHSHGLRGDDGRMCHPRRNSTNSSGA